MAKALTKSNGYKTLVKKIAQELAELEVFVKNRVAKGYWNVGRERTTLQLSVRFYRAYPIRGIPHELTWEHYKGLITVKDATERKKLEEKIVRQKGDARKLRKYLSVKRNLAAAYE